MIPKTIVEKDKSGLEGILALIQELLDTRFVEGIKCKHHTIYEIKQTTEMVKMKQHRLNIEAYAVAKFSETFIRSFATPNNKCFETALVLFGKVRSTIAGLKQIFKKMTPKDYTQLPPGVEAPTVFEKSPLAQGIYTEDMFGLESYSDEVKELYDALETMFATASATLALCHLMIEDEEKTRNDVVRLLQIYHDTCDELMDTAKAASMFIVSTTELPENELENCRKQAGSDENDTFLKQAYHKYDKQVFTQYLIIKTIREGQRNGLTEQEAFFWRNDYEKALKVRKVVENFDKVKNIEGQKGCLGSRVIVEFLKWCGVRENQEKLLYENYFRPKYSAKFSLKVLGWTTISGKRKELKETWDQTDEQLAQSFEERLELIFPSEEQKQSDSINQTNLKISALGN